MQHMLSLLLNATRFLAIPNTLPYNSYYNKWRSAKAVTPVRFSFLAA